MLAGRCRIAVRGHELRLGNMFFFSGFALLAALAFGLYARRYRKVDNYRTATASFRSRFSTAAQHRPAA